MVVLLQRQLLLLLHALLCPASSRLGIQVFCCILDCTFGCTFQQTLPMLSRTDQSFRHKSAKVAAAAPEYSIYYFKWLHGSSCHCQAHAVVSSARVYPLFPSLPPSFLRSVSLCRIQLTHSLACLLTGEVWFHSQLVRTADLGFPSLPLLLLPPLAARVHAC